MERRLKDALKSLVDSGAILTRDEQTYRLKGYIEGVSNRQDVSDLRLGVADDLSAFYKWAAHYGLPTHNPVAFFTKALEIEPTLPPEEQFRFKIVLGLAISGRGFVFGTAFDWDRNLGIRPCDVLNKDIDLHIESYTEIKQEKFEEADIANWVYLISIENQAALSGARYFREDCFAVRSLMEKLEQQSKLVSGWKKTWASANQAEIFCPTIRDMFEFWAIYERYCTSQLEYDAEIRGPALDSEKPPISVGYGAKISSIKADLYDLKQTMQLLLHLHCFDKKLERILKMEADDKYHRSKQKWVTGFTRFLRKESTTAALKAAERIAMGQQEVMDDSLGLTDFREAARPAAVADDFKRRYPVLDTQSKVRKLSRAERSAIKGYQKHPMYSCFRKMMKEFSKPYVARIAPYYITYFFIHKQAPKNPFLKKSYTFGDGQTKIDSGLTIASDERQIYMQDCNHFFFSSLCDYVRDRHPELIDQGLDLSKVLYARCRNLVVKKDWLQVESRPIYKQWMADNLMYQLYQKLDGIFAFSSFPIYAKSICRAEDMFYFFYEKQDQKIVKVKRAIRRLIDSNLVKEYKEKVFLSEDGMGNSTMPLKWHEELAEWLEGVIKKDHDILEYIEGDSNPYYPASKVKLSEINQTISWVSNQDQIYPEDLQPYLSVVEWYIQKVCCERIGEEMRSEVFGLCKRVFSDF